MKKNEEKLENKIILDENNNYSKELEQLLEMGFEKQNAYNAIKSSNGNIELAIDYLYNGIPKNNSFHNSSMEVNVGDVENEVDDDENGEDYEDITYLLKKLGSIIKILIKEKKKTKDELLEIIQKYNFRLFQFIKENEEEFNSYLNSPLTKEDQINFDNFKNGKDNFGAYHINYKMFDYDINNNIIDENLFKNNNKSHSLGNDLIEEDISFDDNKDISQNLSNQDKEIINRLKELGNFSEDETVQAYFACEKNEEMTAN